MAPSELRSGFLRLQRGRNSCPQAEALRPAVEPQRCLAELIESDVANRSQLHRPQASISSQEVSLRNPPRQEEIRHEHDGVHAAPPSLRIRRIPGGAGDRRSPQPHLPSQARSTAMAPLRLVPDAATSALQPTTPRTVRHMTARCARGGPAPLLAAMAEGHVPLVQRYAIWLTDCDRGGPRSG